MEEKRNRRTYDLEERTEKFGEKIIDLCKGCPKNAVINPLVSQLVRSGTSIAANYTEANAASSRKDFRNKIFICKKEAQETRHWLRMIYKCTPENTREIKELKEECQELVLIFQKITSSLDKVT